MLTEGLQGLTLRLPDMPTNPALSEVQTMQGMRHMSSAHTRYDKRHAVTSAHPIACSTEAVLALGTTEALMGQAPSGGGSPSPQHGMQEAMHTHRHAAQDNAPMHSTSEALVGLTPARGLTQSTVRHATSHTEAHHARHNARPVSQCDFRALPWTHAVRACST